MLKKEFKSPYHALAAQNEALVQLIDALRNAEEHCLHLHVYYHPFSKVSDVPHKVVIEAYTDWICDFDYKEVPLPETTEWDISYLFRSEKTRQLERFCLWLTQEPK